MIKETIRKAIIAGTAAAALLTGSDTMVYAKNETLTENVVSQIVYVLDTNTGEVVTERNSEESMYPASMTKMMTVLVGLEHLNNMDETIRITDEMLAGLVEANASTTGFAEGDMPTVRDILYGSAIPSGADASNALPLPVPDPLTALSK
jgi:D-alanyl-D-alanine carboxypeptidase